MNIDRTYDKLNFLLFSWDKKFNYKQFQNFIEILLRLLCQKLLNLCSLVTEPGIIWNSR